MKKNLIFSLSLFLCTFLLQAQNTEKKENKTNNETVDAATQQKKAILKKQRDKELAEARKTWDEAKKEINGNANINAAQKKEMLQAVEEKFRKAYPELFEKK
jgi:Flp pilus assembly protein TadB